MVTLHARHGIFARETLLALLVLALVFLNFGHTNLAFANDGRVLVTGHSFCGDPLTPADGDHTPCHACRTSDVAVLPPPPAVAAPVRLAIVALAYADAPQVLAGPLLIRTGNPRAPPLV